MIAYREKAFLDWFHSGVLVTSSTMFSESITTTNQKVRLDRQSCACNRSSDRPALFMAADRRKQ